jgi:hypothetical protein
MERFTCMILFSYMEDLWANEMVCTCEWKSIETKSAWSIISGNLIIQIKMSSLKGMEFSHIVYHKLMVRVYKSGVRQPWECHAGPKRISSALLNLFQESKPKEENDAPLFHKNAHGYTSRIILRVHHSNTASHNIVQPQFLLKLYKYNYNINSSTYGNLTTTIKQ